MARFQRKVILAKIESAYGVDPTATGAANTILLRNVDITPVGANLVPREAVRPWRGREKTFLADTHVMIEGSVELAPSGDNDTPPAYGPLLRACALAETINASTSVEYDPVSEGEESVWIEFYLDGTKHIASGARGSVALQLTAGQVPELRFRLTGLYVAPAADTDPTPTFTPWQAPKVVSKANTPTFTLHSLAAILNELSLDLANEVTVVDRVGATGYRVDINDRAPSGQVTIEGPALGTKDFFAIAKAETAGALQLIHGSGAGNIVQLDAPNVQLLNPRYVELSGGTAGLTMDLNLIPGSAGDDEIKITTK